MLSEDEKKEYFFKFNVEGLLRGDYASRMTGYSTARQNGWMSANDIRELENLDRMLAEGVVLRINFVNIGRFALGCAVDIGSGARKTAYEFMSIELTTGSMAVSAERTFLYARKRRNKADERELILAKALGEEIAIDKSGFSLEEAQLAAKELSEKKILSYEEMRDRPWYKKLYAAATFHSADKKHILEDVQAIEQILSSFMKAYDSEMDQLDKRVARLENVVVKQQEELAKREAAPASQQKPEPTSKATRTKKSPLTECQGERAKFFRSTTA